MKARNRTGFVLSAIARFHGGALNRHRDDAGQIVELACLMHDDDAGALRSAMRMFRRAVDYRRPITLSIDGFDFPCDEEAEDAQRNERLWSLVDKLHPRQREAIVRAEIDDIPRDVVAEELGVTGTELGQLIRSARKRLRHLFDSEGVSP